MRRVSFATQHVELNTVLSDSVRHPDKNKSPEAHEKILEINKAYEVTQTVLSGVHVAICLYSILVF